MPAPVYSVIVPVRNEEEVLRGPHDRLISSLTRMGEPVEVIYLDDGSTDRTLEILRSIVATDERVRALSFSRESEQLVSETLQPLLSGCIFFSTSS